MPFLRAQLAPPPRLAGSENREEYARLRQHLERFNINGGFGQPHALGTATEPVAKVGDAPGDLSLLVMPACKRHDHVIVNLGECVAVAPAPLEAEPVGLDDRLEHGGLVLGQPVQERGAEVEAHPGVIVEQIDDPAALVEDPRAGIGRVALACDPLVPVVKGRGRVLDLDGVKPGVLAGRLIKVAVNADVSGVAHAWEIKREKPRSQAWVDGERSLTVAVAGAAAPGTWTSSFVPARAQLVRTKASARGARGLESRPRR